MLGIYLSGHPLSKLKEEIENKQQLAQEILTQSIIKQI